MHGKIIKIHNHEILKQKRHKIFDYISVDMVMAQFKWLL
jgi:hypothetical protein